MFLEKVVGCCRKFLDVF